MVKWVRHHLKELFEISPETFTRRVSLITVVFTAMLALTFLGNMNAIRNLMRTQIQFYDQHSLYQSLTTRELLYKTSSIRMQADILDRGPAMKPNTRTLYNAMLNDMKTDEIRYREDKKKVEEQVTGFEAKRVKIMARAASFDVAGFFLLVAIILAAISILKASQRLFNYALGSAVIGTIFMLNGYLFAIRLPFIH